MPKLIIHLLQTNKWIILAMFTKNIFKYYYYNKTIEYHLLVLVLVLV